MPRPPKDPKTRQRRNRDSTSASLIDTSPLSDGEIPKLPDRKDEGGNKIPWRPEAKKLWEDIWSSPMATEYTQADIHRVLLYVDLWDTYWCKPSTSVAAEIRLQGVCLGVTPIDRRRLQWEIKRVDAEPSKPSAPKRPERQSDPRSALRVVPKK